MAIGNPDLPQAVIPAARAEVTGESKAMRFPAEHGRYFTLMKFVSYKRTNPKLQAMRVDQADVVLPLPSNLREYYSLAYNDVEFDQLGGLTDSSTRIIDDYLSGGLDAAGLTSEILKSGGELSEALTRRTANFISSELSGVIDRVTGTAVNPHITSVFKGVNLRSHSLQWKFVASSPEESKAITDIRDYIRNRAHPTKKSEFLLNFPDEVYVSFFAGDKPFLFQVFKSVVADVVSDLSSDGTNAFFKGTDAPVVVGFTVNLREVEGLTREDFVARDDGGAAAPTPTNESGTGVQRV